jgi:hypothetical protein
MYWFDNPLKVAFVVVCSILAFVGAILAVKLREKITDRRIRVSELGHELSQLGFVFAPELCRLYGAGKYVKLLDRVEDFLKVVTGGPAKLLPELSRVIYNIARDPEGLKLLQEVIAKAEAAKATEAK